MILLLTLLQACAQQNSLVFKSDEYVIRRLNRGDTPSLLAKKYLNDPGKAWIVEESNKSIAFKPGQIIVIPLKDENIGGVKSSGYQVIPIVSYHKFGIGCSSPLCMPQDAFERQMKYLKENGYHVLSLDDIAGFLEYKTKLPEKSVILTVDDGYRSVYNIAYPILRKYGFTATLFIYTNYVGVSKSAITWDQLREMKKDGFEIGSHTVSHCDLSRKLKNETYSQYYERIKKELLLSKQILDKQLRQNTTLLAFPYGRQNQTVLDISQSVGYKLAVTVKTGSNPFFENPLALQRSQILKRDISSFKNRIRTFNQIRR